jgi:hypothetical protein
MDTDLDQRDLTRAEVEALPASDIRDIALAAFACDEAADSFEWDRVEPVAFQYLRHPDTGPIIVPNPIGIGGDGTPHEKMAAFAAAAHSDKQLMDCVRQEDATFVAFGLLYHQTSGVDLLEPQVTGTSGSKEVRLLPVVVADGAEVLVQRVKGEPPIAHFRRYCNEAIFEELRVIRQAFATSYEAAHETTTPDSHIHDEPPGEPVAPTSLSDLEQRDLTCAEVEALPVDSETREILLASFSIEAMADRQEAWKFPPLPFQYMRRSDVPDGIFMVPAAVDHPSEYSALEAMTYLADNLEAHPDLWPRIVPPERDASYLAQSVMFAGWTMPAEHTSEDVRDPADVPGAIPTRYIRGICVDGREFTVFRRRGQEPLARAKPAAYGDSEEGRADSLYQAIKRVHKVCALAYSDSSPTPDYVDEAEPTEPGPSQAKAPVDAEPTELIGLTLDQLKAQPPSDLRDLAVVAMDAELQAHHAYGWDETPPTAFKHHRHAGELHGGNELDGGTHDCFIALMLVHGGPAPDRLLELATAISEDSELQGQLANPRATYTGVSFMHEAWTHSGDPAQLDDLPAGQSLADVAGSQEARLIVGLSRGGGVFLVRRARGTQPVVDLIEDFDDAAIAMGGPLMDALRAVNTALIELHNEHDIEPSPNASLDELPPEYSASADGVLARYRSFSSLMAEMVMLTSRWRIGEPREGRIYPALPADHPLAQRLCACGDPLSNGRPLQTYTILPDNPEGREAHSAGDWHDSMAALLHQRCVVWASASFAKALARFARGE